MAKRPPPLETINARLERAIRALSRVAGEIRDAELNASQNIRKVGQALGCIFDIQHDIYRRVPKLLPVHLRDTALGREVLGKRARQKRK
jgi:hypothetical protein